MRGNRRDGVPMAAHLFVDRPRWPVGHYPCVASGRWSLDDGLLWWPPRGAVDAGAAQPHPLQRPPLFTRFAKFSLRRGGETRRRTACRGGSTGRTVAGSSIAKSRSPLVSWLRLLSSPCRGRCWPGGVGGLGPRPAYRVQPLRWRALPWTLYLGSLVSEHVLPVDQLDEIAVRSEDAVPDGRRRSEWQGEDGDQSAASRVPDHLLVKVRRTSALDDRATLAPD